MCIDLFCPGRRLDIDFLLEQIWFHVDQEEPSVLRVTEVYDILVRNPKGSDPITELWALFPNDCIKDDDFQIKPIPISPDMQVDNDIYEWPYRRKPTWKDEQNHDIIIWEIVAEPKDVFGKDYDTLEGKSLRVTIIDFPDIRQINQEAFQNITNDDINKCQEILASQNVLKTLVRLSFPGTILNECESGWLRLIVKPHRLDASPPKALPLPGVPDEVVNDYIYSYEQRLEVICPLVLRDNLYQSLDDTNLAALYLKIFLEELFRKGTCTRIEDHRIAVLIPSLPGLDIHDTHCTTTGVRFYGISPLKERERMVFIWGCGSSRNLESDLVHNAMRVIQRLARFAPVEIDQLKSELAPSGRFEAFSLLVNLMIEVGLLKAKEQDGKLNIFLSCGRAVNPKEDDFDFNKLRSKFLFHDVEDHDINLLKVFNDLHPFRIFFRVVWSFPSEKCKNLIRSAIAFAENPYIGKIHSPLKKRDWWVRIKRFFKKIDF